MASDSTDASRPADSADAPRPLVLHIEISPHLAALCKDVVDTYLGRGASNGGLLKAVLLEGVAVVTAVLKAREAKAEEEKEEEETSEEAEMTDLPPTGLPPAACIDVLLVEMQNTEQRQWSAAIHAAMTSPPVLAYVAEFASVEHLLRCHSVEAPFRETLLAYLDGQGFSWYKQVREKPVRSVARALVWRDGSTVSEVRISDEFVCRVNLDMAFAVDGPGLWRADSMDVVIALVRAYRQDRACQWRPGDDRDRYSTVGTREVCKCEVARGLRVTGMMFAEDFSLPAGWAAHSYVVETGALVSAQRKDACVLEEVLEGWTFSACSPGRLTPVHVATFSAPSFEAAIVHADATWPVRPEAVRPEAVRPEAATG